jgi:hypothetical protein
MGDDEMVALWREKKRRDQAERQKHGARLDAELAEAVARGECAIVRVDDHWRVQASDVVADFWPTTGTVRVMKIDTRPGGKAFEIGTRVHSARSLLGLMRNTAKLRATMTAPTRATQRDRV